MAIYETVFVLRGDMASSQVEEDVEAFKKIIEAGKGKLLKEENWGLRTLAYKIKKNKKGYYILLETDASPAAIAELERKLGLSENVLRFLTVKREERSKGQSAILTEKDYKDFRSEREFRDGNR